MVEELGVRKQPQRAVRQRTSGSIDKAFAGRAGGKVGGEGAAGASLSSRKSSAAQGVGGRTQKPAPEVVDHISRQLRAIYDDVLAQPVPSRFTDLLSLLDEERED